MMGDLDLGVNSRRRTRSNDNLGSRAITITSLACSMLLGSQDAASSARHLARARRLSWPPTGSTSSRSRRTAQLQRVGVDSSAQAGGCYSVGAGAAHGAMASAVIRMVVGGERSRSRCSSKLLRIEDSGAFVSRQFPSASV
jgi:hypothetical protein